MFEILLSSAQGSPRPARLRTAWSVLMAARLCLMNLTVTVDATGTRKQTSVEAPAPRFKSSSASLSTGPLSSTPHSTASNFATTHNQRIVMTTSDVALWSQFVLHEDQTSAWSDDSGNTQDLLGFDSMIGTPVTVSTTVSAVENVNHVSQLPDAEWNAGATFEDLPSSGGILIAPSANSPTAPTTTPSSSSYSGGLNYLDPVSSQLLDGVATFGDLSSGGGTLIPPDFNSPTAPSPTPGTSSYSGGFDYLDPVSSQFLDIERNAMATFEDLPSGGGTLTTPNGNFPTAPTPTPSSYSGGLDHLDPVSSQCLNISQRN